MKKRSKALVLLAVIPLVLIQFVPYAVASAWVYMVGMLETAKREGVYATPVDAMQARIRTSWIGVERVEIEHAGPNAFDGSNPHVWFVTAKVWAASRGDGRPLSQRGYDLAGSFFLHVESGWVHVSEGSLPELLGACMEFFDYWG